MHNINHPSGALLSQDSSRKPRSGCLTPSPLCPHLRKIQIVTGVSGSLRAIVRIPDLPKLSELGTGLSFLVPKNEAPDRTFSQSPWSRARKYNECSPSSPFSHMSPNPGDPAILLAESFVIFGYNFCQNFDRMKAIFEPLELLPSSSVSSSSTITFSSFIFSMIHSIINSNFACQTYVRPGLQRRPIRHIRYRNSLIVFWPVVMSPLTSRSDIVSLIATS